jgi:hypothetical protein
MEEFFVVFVDTDRWFNVFLKKNFGHCFVMKKTSINVFILINPYLNYIGCYCVSSEYFNEILCYAKVLYLKKELDNTKEKANFWFTPRTCVSVVKGFLGETDARCITPYGLYKHLRKQGALILN